jgi:hypothetical protein
MRSVRLISNADGADLPERFPLAKTTKDSISWYRAQLRKDAPEALTDRMAREMRELKR